MIIKIKDLVNNALSVNDGIIVREELLKYLDCGEEIHLDFEGVSLFATMFFNAFVGYFIKIGKKSFIQNLKFDNISQLGLDTFQHSYNNAVFVMQTQDAESIVDNIIKSNIENM